MNKICEIINDRFSWILKVDGHKVSFIGSDIADYFEEHYKLLGYQIIRDNDKWKREE
jgi:hypothetical protein